MRLMQILFDYESFFYSFFFSFFLFILLKSNHINDIIQITYRHIDRSRHKIDFKSIDFDRSIERQFVWCLEISISSSLHHIVLPYHFNWNLTIDLYSIWIFFFCIFRLSILKSYYHHHYAQYQKPKSKQ